MNHAEYEKIQVALLHYQPLLKMFTFFSKGHDEAKLVIFGK